jgi:hypothetical protein
MTSGISLQLQALEEQPDADPASEALRQEILSAYLTHELANHPRRIHHIVEYVRRFARDPTARCPLVHVDGAAFPDAFKTVEEEWLRLQHQHPGDPEIARGFACFMAVSNRARAVSTLEEALRETPEDPGLWVDLGRICPEPHQRLRALLKARALGAPQPNLLVWIARAAVEANDTTAAEQAGVELLSLVEQARSEYGEKLDWPESGRRLWHRARAACGDDVTTRTLVAAISDHANRKHWGHTTLGMLALRRGDISTARNHLLESCAVVGEPRLSSYGPSFLLARELCNRGQWDAVSAYLGKSEAFWDAEQLRRWRHAVERHQVPDFFDQ